MGEHIGLRWRPLCHWRRPSRGAQSLEFASEIIQKRQAGFIPRNSTPTKSLGLVVPEPPRPADRARRRKRSCSRPAHPAPSPRPGCMRGSRPSAGETTSGRETTARPAKTARGARQHPGKTSWLNSDPTDVCKPSNRPTRRSRRMFTPGSAGGRRRSPPAIPRSGQRPPIEFERWNL